MKISMKIKILLNVMKFLLSRKKFQMTMFNNETNPDLLAVKNIAPVKMIIIDDLRTKEKNGLIHLLMFRYMIAIIETDNCTLIRLTFVL